MKATDLSSSAMERGKETPNVVFVGSFQETAADGAVGGSLYAATSLIKSSISRHINWILVDSTCRSVPPPNVLIRLCFAIRRMFRFVLVTCRREVDATLIFAGAHLGFIEKGIMALVSKSLGKPVVFSPRSGMMIDAVRDSRFHRFFVRYVLSRCDRIMCQGETWRVFYRDVVGLPSERMVSIPNWIRLADYADIRRAGNLAPASPVFLYLGWIETYKGIFDLVRAVNQSRHALGNARILICGRGGSLLEAQRLCDQFSLGQMIEFRGWVVGPEKLRVLQECDVLVLPSHREGLPNALLEAMATGLAVIATRVGAIPDVLEDGRSGILIDPGDVQALGRALVKLAGDPGLREQMGRVAQDRIARDHDIEIVWPRVLNAIRQALGDCG